MKIVHVVYSLEMGGAEVVVAELCRVQRRAGHDVSVCAYSSLGAIGSLLREEGFAVFVPGEAHPLRTMLRYLRHFRALRPDVVHCHNPAPTVQAAISARVAGVRCIVSTRHSLVAPPYDLVAELKYNLCARACHSITGICETTCTNLRGVPGALRDRIVCVYNGVTAVERSATPEGAKPPFLLLFVGRLVAVKDLGTVLKAISLLKDRLPGLAFWIVGDGPARAGLEKQTMELGLGDNVRFWGQRLDTAPFFSAADLFVMSSVSEGLPMSLLQAMSLGIPAVLTDVGGMAEVLRLAEAGLLAPVGASVAMAEAILRLAENAPLREQFSSNACAAYQAHFTLEAMHEAYLRLYASV